MFHNISIGICLVRKREGMALPFNTPNFPNEKVSNNQQGNTHPTFAERLGLVANVVSAIGDILAVAAARLSIEEGIQGAIQDEKDKTEQDQVIKKMQDQIDALQNEVKLLKKKST